MAPNEAIGTGYKHPGLFIHLLEYRRKLIVSHKNHRLNDIFSTKRFPEILGNKIEDKHINEDG